MQIVIVGAGAAGMMAAATAARALGTLHRGDSPSTASADDSKLRPETHRVIVLEKNRKAGVKILMSGGTRCNLTHDCEPAGIMQAFGRNGQFLRQALAALPPDAVVKLFNSLGVPTQIESTGKIFPQSDRALDVRDALQRYATDAGAEIRLGVSVKSIVPDGGAFRLETSDGLIEADRVIVTSGGRSYPGCGTIGEGYQWMQTLGHSIVKPRPALVPLVGGEDWMHELSGLTLDEVRAAVWQVPAEGKKADKRPLIERTGGFLFTHQGFSGPTPMDVSGTITAASDFSMTRMTLDLLPEKPAIELEQSIESTRRSDGRRRVTQWLSNLVPKRLADSIATRAHLFDKTFAELPRGASQTLVAHLKQLPLPVTGTRGFEKAEVTAGGVSLKEVDPRTMQSRLVPGLFIAGEILDLDGWIGGYNFQSAFSTGHLAGLHAAVLDPTNC